MLMTLTVRAGPLAIASAERVCRPGLEVPPLDFGSARCLPPPVMGALAKHMCTLAIIMICTIQ